MISPAGHEEIRAAFDLGRVLQDRYVLERELGRGGMGQVYWRDNRLSRLVAIKVMLPAMETNRDPTEPTRRRCTKRSRKKRLGANLTHPAIVRFSTLDFTRESRSQFSNTFRARRLQECRASGCRLTMSAHPGASGAGADFARSARGASHLISPTFAPTPQGQFKILDLGWPKTFGSDGLGRVRGTPASSPEQAAGLASDGRTDHDSLAVIAYEMLTGSAFHHRDPMELLRMHHEESPPSPQTVAPERSNPSAACCGRCGRTRTSGSRLAKNSPWQWAASLALCPDTRDSLEADAHSRPNFWSISSWQIGSSVRRMYLVLEHDSVWCDWHAGVLRWRVTALTKIKRPRWSKDLLFTAPSTHGTVRHRIRFCTGKECKQWYETLCALNGGLESGAVRGEEEPPQRPVILLRRRPSARYQLLGPVEVSRKKRWSGAAGLRVRGAMMEADAIIEVLEEQVPGFRGTVK